VFSCFRLYHSHYNLNICVNSALKFLYKKTKSEEGTKSSVAAAGRGSENVTGQRGKAPETITQGEAKRSPVKEKKTLH